jgi:uncharacterized membrane protein
LVIPGRCSCCFSKVIILGIIGILTQQGRLNKISNEQLNNYSFPKHIENKLLSNKKDRDHLKTILLSYRKLAITLDDKFRRDISNYPKVDKIKPTAGSSPDEVNYF